MDQLETNYLKRVKQVYGLLTLTGFVVLNGGRAIPFTTSVSTSLDSFKKIQDGLDAGTESSLLMIRKVLEHPGIGDTVFVELDDIHSYHMMGEWVGDTSDGEKAERLLFVRPLGEL